MGQSRRRVSRHKTRKHKKNHPRKKNKSRRGDYTKKRKVMVGGTLPKGWENMSEYEKNNFISHHTIDSDVFKEILEYEQQHGSPAMLQALSLTERPPPVVLSPRNTLPDVESFVLHYSPRTGQGPDPGPRQKISDSSPPSRREQPFQPHKYDGDLASVSLRKHLSGATYSDGPPDNVSLSPLAEGGPPPSYPLPPASTSTAPPPPPVATSTPPASTSTAPAIPPPPASTSTAPPPPPARPPPPPPVATSTGSQPFTHPPASTAPPPPLSGPPPPATSTGSQPFTPHPPSDDGSLHEDDDSKSSASSSSNTKHDIPVGTIEQKMNSRKVICDCIPKSKPSSIRKPRPKVSKKTQKQYWPNVFSRLNSKVVDSGV